jgi:hypothetical protein
MRKPLRKLFLVFFILQLTAFSAVGALVLVVEGVHQLLAHDKALDHHHHGIAQTHTNGQQENSPHKHDNDSVQSIGILVSAAPAFVVPTTRPSQNAAPEKPPDRFWVGLYRPPRTLL